MEKTNKKRNEVNQEIDFPISFGSNINLDREIRSERLIIPGEDQCPNCGADVFRFFNFHEHSWACSNCGKIHFEIYQGLF
jgi:ribosomal protein S27AE